MQWSIAACCVLLSLWCVTDSHGCDFPDFNFSIKKAIEDCQVQVDFDPLKNQHWEVEISKTSNPLNCHQSILLDFKKGPTASIAKFPPAEVTENPAEFSTKSPKRIKQKKPIHNNPASLVPNPRIPQTSQFDPWATTTPPPKQQPSQPEEPRYPPVQTPTQKPRPSPPYGYKYVRNHNYYKIHRNSRFTWFEAKETCEAEGTHLTVINSQDEAKAIGSLIVREGTRSYDHWIGANGIQDEGWLTIYNETLKDAGYDHWWPGQPDYAPGYGQCVIFKYRSENDMGYLDLACRYDAIFICEFDQQ